MDRFLGKYEELLYALFRFMFGLAFIFHGTQKLFAWPGDAKAAELFSQRGLAGVIEVFGGAMIALGLWSAWAAFIASGTMAFAYFMRHAPDSFWPIVNRGELAVLYCFAFLYIASRGSGRYSIEQAFSRRRLR
ncbi:MAG TPA: DoxX family protein [Thermoanaerobaculia bacterium]|nr:DoxX family protein [Thermoanaerobaculia bacterium]